MNIKLFENEIPFYTEGTDTPNCLTFYPAPTHHPSPCIVIFPGGGYSDRANHEGEPVAEYFVTRGFHACVVHYRVAPNRHPAPLCDAQRAIKLIRSKSTELYVDPDKIVTLGFSAGGHLAASTITLDEVETKVDDEISKQSCLPNGAILCYPVIDICSDFANKGCGKKLLGDDYDKYGKEFCLQNKVNDKTPPVFLWHTSNDQGVSVLNSVEFAKALREHKLPFEMHIFPDGAHGLGLALLKQDVSKWASLAADWVMRNI